MYWTEVTINTKREGIEIITAALLELGINGTQIEDDDELKEYITNETDLWDYVSDELLNKPKEDTKIKFYVPYDIYGNELLLNIKQNIASLKQKDLKIDLGTLLIQTKENLNDESWLNEWKKHYKPFNIGKNIIIKPIWEDVLNKENKIIFNINPGHIFGTGLHQTTRLCIENLEKYVNQNSVVLDIGCGTGILSIISILLGAKKAIAIDIDQNAVKVAYENAKLNNISKEKYLALKGDIMQDENIKNKINQNKYNIVLANIIAPVICDICSDVYTLLDKEGIFISSGIIKDKLEDVYIALKKANFKIEQTFFKDDWCCVICKK